MVKHHHERWDGRGYPSPEEAVERLRAGMGSQFDTKVWAAFIQILIEDGV
jgi:HD-GYP domain-containing protein (c-di-GMP phosphodiesterase class II)